MVPSICILPIQIGILSLGQTQLQTLPSCVQSVGVLPNAQRGVSCTCNKVAAPDLSVPCIIMTSNDIGCTSDFLVCQFTWQSNSRYSSRKPAFARSAADNCSRACTMLPLKGPWGLPGICDDVTIGGSAGKARHCGKALHGPSYLQCICVRQACGPGEGRQVRIHSSYQAYSVCWFQCGTCLMLNQLLNTICN